MACFEFAKTGSCSWGDRCRFLHQDAVTLKDQQSDGPGSAVSKSDEYPESMQDPGKAGNDQ